MPVPRRPAVTVANLKVRRGRPHAAVCRNAGHRPRSDQYLPGFLRDLDSSLDIRLVSAGERFGTVEFRLLPGGTPGSLGAPVAREGLCGVVMAAVAAVSVGRRFGLAVDSGACDPAGLRAASNSVSAFSQNSTSRPAGRPAFSHSCDARAAISSLLIGALVSIRVVIIY